MKANDQFIQLLRKHRGPVFGYILSVTNDFHTAEDIFQDVSTIAFRKFNTFRAGSHFGSWIREIARRRILEEQRRIKRKGLCVDQELLEKLDTSFQQTESLWEREKSLIEYCMKKLSDGVRKILRMKYKQVMRIRDIAAGTGRKETAVQVALSRARSAVRECIKKQNEVK